jgi:hypothetical protein
VRVKEKWLSHNHLSGADDGLLVSRNTAASYLFNATKSTLPTFREGLFKGVGGKGTGISPGKGGGGEGWFLSS